MSKESKAAIISGMIAIIGAFLLNAVQSCHDSGKFAIVKATIKSQNDYEFVDLRTLNNSNKTVYITDIKFDIKKRWRLKIASIEKSLVTPTATIAFDFHPYKDEVVTPDNFSFVVKKGEPERIIIKVHSQLAMANRDPFLALVGVYLITDDDEIFLDNFLFNFSSQGVFYSTSDNIEQIKEIISTNANMTDNTRIILKQIANSK